MTAQISLSPIPIVGYRLENQSPLAVPNLNRGIPCHPWSSLAAQLNPCRPTSLRFPGTTERLSIQCKCDEYCHVDLFLLPGVNVACQISCVPCGTKDCVVTRIEFARPGQNTQKILQGSKKNEFETNVHSTLHFVEMFFWECPESQSTHRDIALILLICRL